jgi:hypothetical protein
MATTPVQNRQQTPGSGKGYSVAKVNQVSVDATPDDADIVLGMFYVNAIPATILFDSGATHSFMSARYANTNKNTTAKYEKTEREIGLHLFLIDFGG